MTPNDVEVIPDDWRCTSHAELRGPLAWPEYSMGCSIAVQVVGFSFFGLPPVNPSPAGKREDAQAQHRCLAEAQ